MILFEIYRDFQCEVLWISGVAEDYFLAKINTGVYAPPHPMDGVYAPPDWVRDNVVNAFFKLLDFEYGHNPQISRFGTSFMWDSYKYYPFAKLCSKLAMGNVHESLHHLYLPLLVLNNHWIIVVVQFKDWKIDIYDSLDNQHRNITKTLVQWFQAMFGEDQEWHVDDHYLDVSVQRQSDLYSCGFYTQVNT